MSSLIPAGLFFDSGNFEMLKKYLVHLKKEERVKQVVVSADSFKELKTIVQKNYPEYELGRVSDQKSEIAMFRAMKKLKRGSR